MAQVLAFVRGEADTPDVEGSGLQITVGAAGTVVDEPIAPAVLDGVRDLARRS